MILLRRGGRHVERGLEVLLAQRSHAARFMPGVWVFPGGAVGPEEGVEPGVDAESVDEAAYRACALREVEEEVGIALEGPDSLVPYSRWITPEPVPIRFDTRFYLALAPAHSPPRPDEAETVAVEWVAPAAALDRSAHGGLSLVFPTIKHLESLRGFRDAAEALEAARRRPVEPILPRVIEEGEGRRIALPGDPGYQPPVK